MMKIGICTLDRLLFRRLCLLLDGRYEVVLFESEEEAPDCDIRIADLDTVRVRDADLTLSRVAGVGDMLLPFSSEEIEEAIEKLQKSNTGRLILQKDSRSVRLGGRTVRLTDVEFRLLSVLMSVPVGVYVSKERLVEEVWGEGTGVGVVNVYIHYLREKLETDGERIILSSRNMGYKINERTAR